MEAARSMIIQAHLSNLFWAETGAKFPMEIIDLYAIKKIFGKKARGVVL